ncbi:endonuclease/exonuclease/phosphatase family protein [Neorhizobium galegae]|uniref:endonuclease/exonuclease/phosphatase family protein n=1 Tax=Neorhizobium galegae TaxID=399 RepID=UPI002104B612|nr:endonuclease/exonuclease/phosphatase family protein [Neorhizobium galegae]MCQ1854463.1 endonuclease/exonuclease/phosphatase family protein [Neorhizobium galegae]
MLRILVAVVTIFLISSETSARQVTIATWNLGWHMDIATAQRWIEACGKTYVEDAGIGRWVPSTDSNATQGWDVPNTFDIENWDTAVLPVCDVYAYRGVVRVNVDAYRKRQEQIANFISRSVPADIIAFQEVSGEQAVKEVLPGAGADYDLCGFSGYKVQRLVIAWKKSLGTKVSCNVEDGLSLPANPESKRPRPGLSLTLSIGGDTVRILDVHLKSSCVSPFDGGKLEGNGNNCKILQQQIDPIESWVERETSDGAKVVMLGDFNRNLWHELRDQSPVRTDGSAASGIRPSGVLSRSLLEEVFDGQPFTTDLRLVNEHCQTNEVGAVLCTLSEIRDLDTAESDLLASQNYLGCRNPVGLDHILIGPGIEATAPAEHTSIRRLGMTRQKDDGTDQVLAISDHCPLVVRLNL